MEMAMSTQSVKRKEKNGVRLIANQYLINKECNGRLAKIDERQNKTGKLAKGAAQLLIYVIGDHELPPSISESVPNGWNRDDWEKEKEKTNIEKLAMAGALIANEIDRLKYKPKEVSVITDCEFISCALNNGNGVCVSTNDIQCESIPSAFDPDKER